MNTYTSIVTIIVLKTANHNPINSKRTHENSRNSNILRIYIVKLSFIFYVNKTELIFILLMQYDGEP